MFKTLPESYCYWQWEEVGDREDPIIKECTVTQYSVNNWHPCTNSKFCRKSFRVWAIYRQVVSLELTNNIYWDLYIYRICVLYK